MLRGTEREEIRNMGNHKEIKKLSRKLGGTSGYLSDAWKARKEAIQERVERHQAEAHNRAVSRAYAKKAGDLNAN